ncbi:MAG: 3-oxoacyl-ACP reductase FabG [Candidatus Eremiobacteraeota bacterium]|nr:3-oxoacyl-ACP reductase FabG [Candidatus Eremiobacteraeota bacterium]MBV8355972.1 3-oxoacyl-ACP reductase FabG [Candidatus Eremiobacteraeota bacterium]
MNELQGRVALVTGSSRNIGRSIALALAAAGAAVVVNARTAEADAAAVAGEIEAQGGAALAVLADVTQPEAVAAMVRAAVERFGRLDILVNNAALRPERAFDEISLEEWRSVLGIMLDGAFLCTRSALPHLRDAGGGAIVNIGGLTGHTGAAHRAHVVTGKAAIIGLTRALAHEFASEGITVNCVSPGMIDTVFSGGSVPQHRSGRTVPVGRLGRPEDIASAVRWLAGPGARYVTGQTIHVNGGTYMG